MGIKAKAWLVGAAIAVAAAGCGTAATSAAPPASRVVVATKPAVTVVSTTVAVASTTPPPLECSLSALGAAQGNPWPLVQATTYDCYAGWALASIPYGPLNCMNGVCGYNHIGIVVYREHLGRWFTWYSEPTIGGVCNLTFTASMPLVVLEQFVYDHYRGECNFGA